MDYAVLFLSLVALSAGNDLKLGNEGGRRIFNQQLDASAAIWKQFRNVTVNATGNEVIRQVVVKDLRDDKDGEAKVVNGGIGLKDVTIELKSPTVLRGYSFNIEVFAAETDGNEQVSTENSDRVNENIPKKGNDGDENFSSTTTPDDRTADAVSTESGEITTPNSRLTRETQSSTVKIDAMTKSTAFPSINGESTTVSEVIANEVTTLSDGQDHNAVTEVNQLNSTASLSTQRTTDGNFQLYTNRPTEDFTFNGEKSRTMRQAQNPSTSPKNVKGQTSEEMTLELTTAEPEGPTTMFNI